MGAWISLLKEFRMIDMRRLRTSWEYERIFERLKMKKEDPRAYEREYSKSEKEEKLPFSTFPWWLWTIVVALLLLLGFWHGSNILSAPLHIFLNQLVIIRIAMLCVVHEITDEKSFLNKLPKWGLKKATIAIVIISVILFGIMVWPNVIPRALDYTKASTMLSMFTKSEKGSITMFPEITPEEVRVNTDEIAKSIANTKRTSAESWITSVHLGRYKGTLAWLCAVSERPLVGMWLFAESNRIREIIVVPVTDATGKNSFVVPMRMLYAQGLWYGQDILTHASDNFPFRTFTRAYIAERDGNPVLITTSYFDGVISFYDPRIHVWDFVRGNLLAEYTPNDAPSWIVQRWDEDFVATMGKMFGSFRWTRENELYFFNGIPTFSDRSAEPSETQGLRYQAWGGELNAVYLFNNRANKEILELIIIANKDGMSVYSADRIEVDGLEKTLLSPDDAKRLSISGLPVLSKEKETRSYSTPLALLYRIGSNLYYHIPIYEYDGKNYNPIYFALVRATDRTLIREDASHGGILEAIKAAYARVGATSTKETTVQGSITDVQRIASDVWLKIRTDDGKDITVLVKYDDLKTYEEKRFIVFARNGDRIRLRVDQNNIVTNILL